MQNSVSPDTRVGKRCITAPRLDQFSLILVLDERRSVLLISADIAAPPTHPDQLDQVVQGSGQLNSPDQSHQQIGEN